MARLRPLLPPAPSFGEPDISALVEAGERLRTRQRQRQGLIGAVAAVALLVVLGGVVAGTRGSSRRPSGPPAQLVAPNLTTLSAGYLPTDPYPVSPNAGHCSAAQVARLCWAPASTVARRSGQLDPEQVTLQLTIGDAKEFSTIEQRPADSAGESKTSVTLSNGLRAVLSVRGKVTQIFWVYDGVLLTANGLGIPQDQVLRFAGSISESS